MIAKGAEPLAKGLPKDIPGKGSKALRRALATTDAYRLETPTPVPLIVDTTEFITPDVAYEMLLKNPQNRPIAWPKVEEYAAIMRAGGWKLHAQGIILDTNGAILTGQKRLWAVIYAGVGVYMRVSRGNPPDTARVIDRGVPQSARDLASRGTGQRHSPMQASIARAILVLQGVLRPSIDALADAIEQHAERMASLVALTNGTKKTRGVMMILAAFCVSPHQTDAVAQAEDLAAQLDRALAPKTAAECWGRGLAFSLAMEQARRLVKECEKQGARGR